MLAAMAVLWLFLRAVKYRFFEAGEINRYLWCICTMCRRCSRRFQPVRRVADGGGGGRKPFSGWWHLMYLPAAPLIGGVLNANPYHQVPPRLGRGCRGAASAVRLPSAMAWSRTRLLATGVMVYRAPRLRKPEARVGSALRLKRFALCALELCQPLHLAQRRRKRSA